MSHKTNAGRKYEDQVPRSGPEHPARVCKVHNYGEQQHRADLIVNRYLGENRIEAEPGPL